MIVRFLAFLVALFLLDGAACAAVNVFSTDVQMCSGRPWIDITCNGADPTGAADSTTAINNTFNAAITNGWPVFFPAGTFKVTSKLSINFQGQAANGLTIISQDASVDGRTISSGNVLQFYCSGGTTASPAVCNNLSIQGQLTVVGTTTGYVVVLGNTDFSDRQNAVRIEHLIATNAGTGGAIQANYLTDGDLWLSGSTAGGSSSIGAVALEQVQTSKVGGWGSATGASAPGLLLENGASSNNQFLGFAYDPNDATCISITSTSAQRNTWLVPLLPCVTAVNAPTSANKNLLIGPRFAGTNEGPTSPGISIVERGALGRYKAPVAASYTLLGTDDGTIFSAANGTGPLTGFTAASLPITLPDPAKVGAGYTVGFVSDANKAVVLTTSAGAILIAGQQFSQLVVGGPPNALNFETAVLVSDGANFRVAHLSQGAALLNGAQTTLPSHWEFPSGPGYQATQGDNGMVVSSAQVSAGLSVTLPSTTAVQQGYMLGLATAPGHPITLNVNGTSGGTLYALNGGSTTTASFYRGNGVQVFLFDGSAFRQILGSFYGDVRDWGAKCDGTTDDTAALTFAIASTTAPLLFPFQQPCYVASNLSLGATTQFICGGSSDGYAPGNNYPATANILLNSTATISQTNVGGKSGIYGCTIARFGMSVPTTLRAAITEVAAFAGTAISCSGSDFTLERNMIIGFATAVSSSCDRLRFTDSKGDDTNFLSLTSCNDTCTIHDDEAWTFVSAPYVGFPQTQTTSVTGATSGGTTLTLTFSAQATPFVIGDTVVLAKIGGITGAQYGRFTVTNASTTQITVGGTFSGAFTSGGTIYLTANRRIGTGFNIAVGGGGGPFMARLYDYGHDVALHYNGGSVAECQNCWLDNDTSLANLDPVPVGLVLNGSSGLTNAFQGFINEPGVAIRKNDASILTVGPGTQMGSFNTSVGTYVIQALTGAIQFQGTDAFTDLGLGTGAVLYIGDGATSVQVSGGGLNGNTTFQTVSTDCPKLHTNGASGPCVYTPTYTGASIAGPVNQAIWWADSSGKTTIYYQDNGHVVSGTSSTQFSISLPSSAFFGGICNIGSSNITLPASTNYFTAYIVPGGSTATFASVGSNNTAAVPGTDIISPDNLQLMCIYE
jgi:hypothetical protein